MLGNSGKVIMDLILWGEMVVKVQHGPGMGHVVEWKAEGDSNDGIMKHYRMKKDMWKGMGLMVE